MHLILGSTATELPTCRRSRAALFSIDVLTIDVLTLKVNIAVAAGATAASITMPLDFAKTVLQCGSELPIHKVLKQTLADKGPAGLFTGMVRMEPHL